MQNDEGLGQPGRRTFLPLGKFVEFGRDELFFVADTLFDIYKRDV